MEQRVEQKWVRLVMILIGLTMIYAMVGLVMTDSQVRMIFIFMAMASFLCAVWFRKQHLTCKKCGQGTIPLKWSVQGECKCNFCGAPIQVEGSEKP